MGFGEVVVGVKCIFIEYFYVRGCLCYNECLDLKEKNKCYKIVWIIN